MKVIIATITAMCVASASAFATIQGRHQAIGGTQTTKLQLSRRGFIESIAVSTAAFGVGAAVGPQAAFGEPRPMYLTEPTAEFKANEEKAMEFKRAQLNMKKEFVQALEKLSTEENNADKLVQDIKELKELVIKAGGMPLGIKKEDMYKQIRAKKSKGFWPTPVEVAYQSLISEVAFQQSPNLEKDLGNPYQ